MHATAWGTFTSRTLAWMRRILAFADDDILTFQRGHTMRCAQRTDDQLGLSAVSQAKDQGNVPSEATTKWLR
jgi:hypothetical protein